MGRGWRSALARVLIAVALPAAAVAQATTSSAAGPGQYGPPEWLPLRSSSDAQPFVVGCVRTNCNFDGASYHDYWAIDLIDHADQPGAPVFAAGRGRVYDVDRSHSACGPLGTPPNYVSIEHGNGVFSIYLHMTSVSVEIGQWVDQTTQIGTVGAVGFTFPCPYYHLHYEVDQVGTGPIDFGPLNACHGSSLVTYPSALGYAVWDDVPPFSLGVWSDGSACVRPTPPSAPRNVVAKPGDRRATVTFIAPASDGGDSVSSYTVTASPGGRRAQGQRSPIVVRQLTNGRRYRFTVVAANAAGASDPSAPSNAVIPRRRR